MSHVILENIATGHTIEAPSSGSLPAGYRIKGVVVTHTVKHPHHKWSVKFATWSQKHGLPTASLLDAARWLLDKECTYCQLGTQVLRAIETLGEERVEEALAAILEAKEANDINKLEEIRKSLWSSEPQESPPQS